MDSNGFAIYALSFSVSRAMLLFLESASFVTPPGSASSPLHDGAAPTSLSVRHLELILPRDSHSETLAASFNFRFEAKISSYPSLSNIRRPIWTISNRFKPLQAHLKRVSNHSKLV